MPHHILKKVILLLLIVTSFSALYGGLNLMLYPDGSSLNLTPLWLIDSPFTNFLIPGIVLFMCIGISGLFVALLFWKNGVKNVYLVILQGVFLYTYIMIQIVIMNTFVILHAVFGGIGIALIFTAWLFKRLRG